MNNLRKPEIPAPPALPRFGSEHFDPQLDALDVASTAQRPTVRPGRAGQVQVRKKIAADATAEVQVEDILIEVYAEEPPPPLTRRSPGMPPPRDLLSESGEAHDSIAMAIASVVPPPPVQSAAVDALLRASDPAFAPFPGHMHAYGPRASFASADYETPSVGPMMMATTPPPARPVLGDARDKRARSRATALAMWATVITVLGVAVGAAMMMAVRNGTYARLRDSAKTALRASSKTEAPVAAAAPPAAVAPAIVVAPAPVATPAPAPVVPSMSVDALPKPAVAADASLVTLPAYAEGHRVFLDGRVLPVVAGTPTTIKCGRHMLKIGSTRRARSVDFACGREVIVQ